MAPSTVSEPTRYPKKQKMVCWLVKADLKILAEKKNLNLVLTQTLHDLGANYIKHCNFLSLPSHFEPKCENKNKTKNPT